MFFPLFFALVGFVFAADEYYFDLQYTGTIVKNEEKNANVTEQEQQEESVQQTHKPKKRFIAIAIAAVIIGAAAYLIHDALIYQSTDDAYVETTTVQVAPRVSGQISEVYITDNQPITEGQLVASRGGGHAALVGQQRVDEIDVAARRALLGGKLNLRG